MNKTYCATRGGNLGHGELAIKKGIMYIALRSRSCTQSYILIATSRHH